MKRIRELKCVCTYEGREWMKVWWIVLGYVEKTYEKNFMDVHIISLTFIFSYYL